MLLNKASRGSTSSPIAGAPALWPASGSGLAASAVLVLILASGCAGDSDPGRSGDAVGEWHHYAADRASTKYSPLDHINPSNVDRLREVWRWTSVETEADTEYRGGMLVPTRGANVHETYTCEIHRSACPTLRPTRSCRRGVPLPGAGIGPQSLPQAFGNAPRAGHRRRTAREDRPSTREPVRSRPSVALQVPQQPARTRTPPTTWPPTA